MRQLTHPGLSRILGPRDAAQPLLTLLDGPARVELSGATAANWVAKTANLLTDSLGRPMRVGLLLPLHWQAVTLLLGGVLSGATVVVARQPADLVGTTAAFVAAEHAEAALDAGVDDVLAVSTLPMGGRLRDLPAMVLDAGAELPVHGDHFAGPAVQGWSVELAGTPIGPVDSLGLDPSDRVLTVLSPAEGLLAGLLGPLAAGSGLLLCPGLLPGDAEMAAEGVTASVGVTLPGLRRLDQQP